MNDLAQAYPSGDPLANEPKASTMATRMGRLLVQSGKLSSAQLNAIINLQTQEGLRFGEAAIKLGLIQAEDVKAILAEQFAYPSIDADTSVLSPCLNAAFQPDGAAAEAMRSLRSELMLRFFNGGDHHGLALVGAEDARGIAHTSANLAISFAQSGARTLLIDANLRQPQLHRWFGIDSRQAGLTDLLAARTRGQPRAIAELKSLSVLPAGTEAPNPQELLASRRYKELLKPLCENYDVVLISTAPMNSSRDAQLVAAQTGAALLVTREHQTRMKDLIKLCENLTGLGVRLLGAALRQ